MVKKFEFMKHTADLKFKVYGKSINEIFENCVLAVSNIFSKGLKVRNSKKIEIKVEGRDKESLLYNFIDELIYIFDTKNFVPSKSKVRIKDNKLSALIYGDDSSNYSDLDSIKSPTYAEMHIKKVENRKWEAQVVVDV